MSDTRLPQPPAAEGNVNDAKREKDGESSSVDNNTDTPGGGGGGDVFLFLLAFRILNALLLQTFFQPDEYFQALEPGWNFAFGPDSGAWITWEWKHHLRSSIHPILFGLIYRAAEAVSSGLGLDAPWRANLLLVAPRLGQAVIAATGDYFTWRLAGRVYGPGSLATAATLALTVVSPWQWFCSTRTFSNSLETTLTIVALYHWPWHWTVPAGDGDGGRGGRRRSAASTRSLRAALVAAALATVLRPTNILIWTCLLARAVLRRGPTKVEAVVFVREAVVCGGAVLAVSGLLDRRFYGAWTLPPLNFVHVNVVQSLAVFYGNNDWHYYLSQGYPLLLTTALPFALLGMYHALTKRDTTPPVLSDLAVVSLAVPAALSLIAHKEVRFIYPLLPALHILAAQPLSALFAPVFRPSSAAMLASSRRRARTGLLAVLLGLNLALAAYTSRVHNAGLLRVMHYLRREFEQHYSPAADTRRHNMTVGFLMPCHSTPWRSHLLAPGIDAWALTCEPPLGLDAAARAAYVDEADQFYAAPADWLHHRFPRSWPDYLVFFQQLEPELDRSLHGAGDSSSTGRAYSECWRGFNSHWHDDWRRQGDVIVWCLFPERSHGTPGSEPV